MRLRPEKLQRPECAQLRVDPVPEPVAAAHWLERQHRVVVCVLEPLAANDGEGEPHVPEVHLLERWRLPVPLVQWQVVEQPQDGVARQCPVDQPPQVAQDADEARVTNPQPPVVRLPLERHQEA